MSDELEQKIVAQVLAALESNQLELPTLPDIALKIRKAFDDPNLSSAQLVDILSLDAVISSHIIKAANSAAFSNGHPIVSVRPAITRLGYHTLRNLVMSSALTKLFQADSAHVKQQLKKLWQHSLHVATVSHVLALKYRHLRPEEAMLAGLVHDIGELPLYTYVDRNRLQLSDEALEKMVQKYRCEVGKKLLQHWNFSDEIVDVIEGHECLLRTANWEQVDYIDIVMMANLLATGAEKDIEWAGVSAVHKLGMSVEECQNFLTTHDAALKKMSGMFGANMAEPEPVDSGVPVAPAAQASARKSSSQRIKMGFWIKIFRMFG